MYYYIILYYIILYYIIGAGAGAEAGRQRGPRRRLIDISNDDVYIYIYIYSSGPHSSVVSARAQVAEALGSSPAETV